MVKNLPLRSKHAVRNCGTLTGHVLLSVASSPDPPERREKVLAKGGEALAPLVALNEIISQMLEKTLSCVAKPVWYCSQIRADKLQFRFNKVLQC